MDSLFFETNLEASMNNKCKKVVSGILASALALSALTLTACGDNYSQNALAGYQTPQAAAKDNGGFAVEYGDYVYFINGAQDYTANNEYGNVVKGSLMRIAKTDLENAQTAATYLTDTYCSKLWVRAK
jgi:phosphodiesterase/alkaline phosphatase D-like protein